MKSALLIHGDFSARDFVKTCLINEYFFTIAYLKLRTSVKIAFHEGTWKIEHPFCDHILISDNSEVEIPDKEIQEKYHKKFSEYPYKEDFRALPAEVICDFIEDTFGQLKEGSIAIEVHQDHRDSWF